MYSWHKVEPRRDDDDFIDSLKEAGNVNDNMLETGAVDTATTPKILEAKRSEPGFGLQRKKPWLALIHPRSTNPKPMAATAVDSQITSCQG
ncbi:hypothetical protein E4U52_005858 [Claviceps spartinae]|nr:hypothetical protein E4U52_005858 [Claviceps spartinae]